jgi:Resolvase, N terminal domain
VRGQDHELWRRRPTRDLQQPAPRLRPGSSPRRIGYARVSTKTQELDRQIRALKVKRCDEIFKDTVSGKRLASRAQLRKAPDSLAPGDELVIAEWDRATRSMWDGLQILKEIIDAEATIRVLDRANIDLTSPIGRGFMAFTSAMAEDERLRIIKRTHEGRAIAPENGVKMGRKFRLNDTCSVPRPASAWPTASPPATLPRSTALVGLRSIACEQIFRGSRHYTCATMGCPSIRGSARARQSSVYRRTSSSTTPPYRPSPANGLPAQMS